MHPEVEYIKDGVIHLFNVTDLMKSNKPILFSNIALLSCMLLLSTSLATRDIVLIGVHSFISCPIGRASRILYGRKSPKKKTIPQTL
jgi:lipid-A-disaccharide synthase-like uncharacterized protein